MCTQSGGDGWAQTQLDDTIRARYAQQVTRLDKAIGGHRVTRLLRRWRASSNNAAAPVCGCGRKIRVAPSTAALGPILCGVCDAVFVDVAHQLMTQTARETRPVENPTGVGDIGQTDHNARGGWQR